MDATITRRGFVSGAAGMLAGAAGMAPMIARASNNAMPDVWDYEYDVVVCGAGGAGIIAALRANDEGCKVICIDANFDTGGHAITSGGSIRAAGGTSIQKEQGIEDSPDLYYIDHTNPIVLDSRFNDRDIVRETADRSVECFEWMLAKGMKISASMPDLDHDKNYLEGGIHCETVDRETHAEGVGYLNVTTGAMCEGELSGAGVIRPFELAGRAEGVDFMMNRHMDALIQDESGRVVGIRASYTPRELPDGTPLVGEHAEGNIDETREEITIRAAKAVILATGGSMGNVAFRTMYDPRWTEEYDGVAGEPWSFQDASGEIAGMAIGAGLGCTANATVQQRSPICNNRNIGVRYGYGALSWKPASQVFQLAGGSGMFCNDMDGVIHVNLKGERFFDEDASVMQGIGERQYDYFAAAMGSVLLDDEDGKLKRVGGPIWAIFDAAYAEDHGYSCEYPDVDRENGYFFSGETLEELAGNIVNKYYEGYPMDPAALVATVQRYNELVDAGADEDFGKPEDLMTKKIETGPFYAAWATPILHDCLTGLRTDAKRRVLTVFGDVIPGLYAAGECAGGMHTHGLGKVETSGYIAGLYAAQE